jgi:flagellar hook-associated protein 3
MRVTSMLPDIQSQLQQSQQNLATALQQVSTGLRVNQLADDPTASASMVRSLSASAAVDRYTSTGNTVLSTLQSADSALSAVVTSLNSALSLGTQGANGTMNAADRTGVATQIQAVLGSVVAQANTAFQGTYVFAGTASTAPPFVQASSSYTSSATTLTSATPLTAGASTTLSDAQTGQSFTFKAAAGDTVATLTQAVSAAVSAGTLSAGTTASVSATGGLAIASSSGVVASSTDAALGTLSATPGTTVANAYAYVGNNDTNSVAVGDNLSVAGNLSGSQVFTSGANVIQSLGSLVNALQTGTSAQIGGATQAISTALNFISQQRIPLGNNISQIDSQETYLAQETVTLTSQQNSLVGVNLAEAATNLSQAELNNSAILAAAAKVVPQTLLDYLK